MQRGSAWNVRIVYSAQGSLNYGDCDMEWGDLMSIKKLEFEAADILAVSLLGVFQGNDLGSFRAL